MWSVECGEGSSSGEHSSVGGVEQVVSGEGRVVLLVSTLAVTVESTGAVMMWQCCCSGVYGNMEGSSMVRDER